MLDDLAKHRLALRKGCPTMNLDQVLALPSVRDFYFAFVCLDVHLSISMSEKQRQTSPISWVTPQYLHQLEMSQIETWSQELGPGLHVVAGTQVLVPSPSASRVCISRKLRQKQSQHSNPDTPVRDTKSQAVFQLPCQVPTTRMTGPQQLRGTTAEELHQCGPQSGKQ